MSRKRVTAVGLIAFVELVSACSDSTPARLTLDADTLISNTSRQMVIPVHAVASDGGLVQHVRLAYSSSSNVVHVWNDGRVACVRSGDAKITIALSVLTAQIVVLCRRHVHLGLVPDLNEGPLWVGGAPREVSVFAYDDSAHTPVRLPRGTAAARIRYDSVARIIGGRVYALSAGRTSVDIMFDGALGSAQIRVVERVVHDVVRLAGSEYRLWHVQPGYYELRLDMSPERADLPGLVLAAYDANCAPAPRDDGQHYFCILKDDSSIIVRNMTPVAADSELVGELTVFRLP